MNESPSDDFARSDLPEPDEETRDKEAPVIQEIRTMFRPLPEAGAEGALRALLLKTAGRGGR